MKHIKNIVVKIGEYTKDGQTKGRYKTVGRVLEDDNGGKMYLLDRTFNPAGVPSDRESIILNVWDVEEKQEAKPEYTSKQYAAASNGGAVAVDDEILF